VRVQTWRAMPARVPGQRARPRVTAEIVRLEVQDRIVTHGGMAAGSCVLLPSSGLSAGIAP
jgi:hypothetical protein